MGELVDCVVGVAGRPGRARFGEAVSDAVVGPPDGVGGARARSVEADLGEAVAIVVLVVLRVGSDDRGGVSDRVVAVVELLQGRAAACVFDLGELAGGVVGACLGPAVTRGAGGLDEIAGRVVAVAGGVAPVCDRGEASVVVVGVAGLRVVGVGAGCEVAGVVVAVAEGVGPAGDVGQPVEV